jgi:hypothetical protein
VAEFSGEFQFELTFSVEEEVEAFLDNRFDIRGVYDNIDEVQGSAFDGDISVFEALEDYTFMFLHGVQVNFSDFLESIQGNVLVVVVLVAEELTKDRRSHGLQSGVGLNADDCPDQFIENGISGVFGGFSVGGEGSQKIVHFLTGVCVVASEEIKSFEKLGL